MNGADRPDRGPVVLDTNVYGAQFAKRSVATVEQYRPIITGRAVTISFVTVAEVRYGARLARWGERKLLELDIKLAAVDVVWPDEQLTEVYIDLRARCSRAGHGLSHKIHEADRWIAATAVWLGVPLVTHDRIFLGVEGLDVLTVLDVDT